MEFSLQCIPAFSYVRVCCKKGRVCTMYYLYSFLILKNSTFTLICANFWHELGWKRITAQILTKKYGTCTVIYSVYKEIRKLHKNDFVLFDTRTEEWRWIIITFSVQCTHYNTLGGVEYGKYVLHLGDRDHQNTLYFNKIA